MNDEVEVRKVLEAVDPDTVTIRGGGFSGQTKERDVVRVKLDDCAKSPSFEFEKRRSGQKVVHARASQADYVTLLSQVLRVKLDEILKYKERY